MPNAMTVVAYDKSKFAIFETDDLDLMEEEVKRRKFEKECSIVHAHTDEEAVGWFKELTGMGLAHAVPCI